MILGREEIENHGNAELQTGTCSFEKGFIILWRPNMGHYTDIPIYLSIHQNHMMLYYNRLQLSCPTMRSVCGGGVAIICIWPGDDGTAGLWDTLCQKH